MSNKNTPNNSSPPHTPALKRKRPIDDRPDNGFEIFPGVATPSFSPFLVVNSKDPERALSSLSIFAVSKALKSCGAGSPKAVSRLRSGSLMIEVHGRTECTNLMKCTSFCGTPVTVETHKTLNRSKGVVKSRDLVGCTEEEMVAELNGVVEARRVTVRRGDSIIQTNTWILTFDSPRPPARIQVEYLDLPVRPYVPNPMRCFNCHRYGHTKANCRRKAACPRCGKEDHEEVGCKAALQCLNCQGAHAANSKDCARWLQEKAILTYRATYGGTFAQAKAKVCPTLTVGAGLQNSQRSYAKVASSGTEQNKTRVVPKSARPSGGSKGAPKKLPEGSSRETTRVTNNLFVTLQETSVEPATPSTPVSTAVSPPPSPQKSPPRSPLPTPSLPSPASPIRGLMEVEVHPPPRETPLDPSQGSLPPDPAVNEDPFVTPVSSSKKKRMTSRRDHSSPGGARGRTPSGEKFTTASIDNKPTTDPPSPKDEEGITPKSAADGRKVKYVGIKGGKTPSSIPKKLNKNE